MKSESDVTNFIKDNLALAAKIIASNPRCIDPFGSYIVVKLLQAKSSAGGVQLTGSQANAANSYMAEVIRVGPGQRSMHDGNAQGVQCSVGDIVYIVKNAAYEINNTSGDKFWIVFEGDILGKLDKQLFSELLNDAKALEAQKPQSNVIVATTNAFPLG